MDYEVLWSPGMSIEDLEQLVIEKAYKFYRRNKTATANSLGISIRTLDARLEKYETHLLEEAERNDTFRRTREAHLARARGVHPAQFNNATAETASYPTLNGVHVESLANASAQPNVSLSESAEIQEVLPKQAPHVHHHKRR